MELFAAIVAVVALGVAGFAISGIFAMEAEINRIRKQVINLGDCLSNYLKAELKHEQDKERIEVEYREPKYREQPR